MSTTILFIGLAVFLAHFLALQFRRTNIPDVLVLVLLGIVIGPVLGWWQPEDFGKIGPHRHHRAGGDPVRERHLARPGHAAPLGRHHGLLTRGLLRPDRGPGQHRGHAGLRAGPAAGADAGRHAGRHLLGGGDPAGGLAASWA
jgi:hypothetical protein